MEAEPDLVRAGLEREFYHGVAEQKAPRFNFGYNFDFGFVTDFGYAMAQTQSLFTHLTLDDISRCFDRLGAVANADSRFYFTFFEGSDAANPETRSDPHGVWHYSFTQLRDCGIRNGWCVNYIGTWSHPRGQMMAVARRRGPG